MQLWKQSSFIQITRNSIFNMIPFLDLKPQNLMVKEKLSKDFEKFLKSGVYILGNQVKTFEENIEKYLGVPYAVGVASGTEAICLALKALGIKEGDEVVVPANSYPSVWGVIQSGANAVLCDVDQRNFSLDLENLKSLLNKKTKAILVVHLFGFNMLSEDLVKLARQKGLIIVEDCAQAFGVKTKNKYLGSLSEAGIFFHFTPQNL